MPTNIMQIQEILKGYTVDRKNIQSVGNMTVLPIVSDIEFTNVADVNEITLQRDANYNSLEFKNSSGKIGIAIQGWAIMDSKQHAQDRTIPYAHLVRAANSKVIPANCIQHTQAGHFDVNAIDHNAFKVLPPTLRSVALKQSSYAAAEVGALWSSLRTWAKGIDCDSRGLIQFYSQYEDRLNQFVAQFEPVEKQLGAIVLINDQIIAIDIMPKYDSWKRVWRAFIRDSYGAEAVRVAEKNGAVIARPQTDTTKIKKFSDLEALYTKMKDNFYDSLQSKFGQAAQLSISYKQLEKIQELSMIKLENDQFIGQGVLHGDSHFIYLSLVSTSLEAKLVKQFSSLRTNPYGSSEFSFS